MTNPGGEHYGNFDAESRSPSSRWKNVGHSANPQQGSRSDAKTPTRMIRVLFRCCNVYSPVKIPERVLNGELSSWRFHCPRCAGLVEIPFDD